MNLLLAGHSAFDTIIHNSKTSNSPGGILYNVIGMLGCSQNEDNIFLLTGLDEKYSFFQPVFEKVDTSFSYEIDAGVRVELSIFDEIERKEKYLNLPEPLSLAGIDNINQFDAVMFNFISGNDFTLEEIKSFRHNFNGIIYADLHTLTRGIDSGGNRYFRELPHKNKWLNCFDIIQVNENELITIAPGANIFDQIKDILNSGPKAVIVTYGKAGAAIFSRNNSEIEYTYISVPQGTNEGCVGCGDIFGAFFFYYYVSGKNLMLALGKAIAGASGYASFPDKQNLLNTINSLKNLCEKQEY